MGRRLRAMWRLRNPDRMPRVLVAPVRSLVQRLGPHVEDVEPVIIKPGDRLDPLDLVKRLVDAGYRREVQVEHRGQVARRGSIVDVFPSTDDHPVRIDLWGDEVDRLTRFSVTDQRSTDDVACVELFPSRELLPTDEVRARAAELVAAEPWGREQWERLAEGAVFEGMESWLPWLTAGDHTLFDLLGPDALVLLVEPRRMRDRAADLLDEEASLAASLATTWGAAKDREWPRLHLPFDRLLAHTPAPAWTVTGAAEGPDVDHHRVPGLGPGDGRLRPPHPPGGRPGGQGLPAHRGRRGQGLRGPDGRPAAGGGRRPARGGGRRPEQTRLQPGRGPAPRARLRPPRGQARRPRRERRHRSAPGPPGAPAQAHRRPGLLRRPQPGRLRRPPPARRRASTRGW